MASKRDPELDKEAQSWIESVIGKKFPDCSYEDGLRDGIILCKYVTFILISQLNMIIFYDTN
jgi:hypothetical protein